MGLTTNKKIWIYDMQHLYVVTMVVIRVWCNSLAPGKCGSNVLNVILNLLYKTVAWAWALFEIALRWMP